MPRPPQPCSADVPLAAGGTAGGSGHGAASGFETAASGERLRSKPASERKRTLPVRGDRMLPALGGCPSPLPSWRCEVLPACCYPGAPVSAAPLASPRVCWLTTLLPARTLCSPAGTSSFEQEISRHRSAAPGAKAKVGMCRLPDRCATAAAAAPLCSALRSACAC